MRHALDVRPRATLAGIAIAVGVLISGCSSTATDPASSASASPSLAGEVGIRGAMADLLETGATPGVVAVVQVDSQKSVIGEGTANVTQSQPMTEDATMRIASVSKAYNGAVVLSLVTKGKLALNSTVAQLLPTAPAAWGKATLGQVLQHTSGIPDYIKNPTFLKQFIANPQMTRTPEQLIAYVANEPLAFAPGTEYEYSDTDNIVAGLIAEKATGKPYSDLLTSEISGPLNLTATSLPTTPAMPEGFIHGYAPTSDDAGVSSGGASSGASESTSASAAAEFEDVSEFLNPGLAWASGGMITTPDELNTFIRAYASGKLASATVVDEQRQFVPGGGGPPGPGTNSSGVGIYQYETACGTVLGHTGNMPGYTVFAASTPDGNRSVVVAANGQITEKVSDTAYQKLVAVWNQAICAATDQSAPSASATPSPTK